jgi:hypothetical protein
MCTCPQNLTQSFFTVCKIITFKVDKKVSFLVPKGDNKVLKAKKTTFSSRHGLYNILFLFLSELDTCLQNLISTIGVEHCEKNYFPQGGVLKFTNKGCFLIIKKACKKLLY